MSKRLMLFSLLCICFAQTNAQNNEISITGGAGSLIGKSENVATEVYTLAYTRNLTDRWALEGSLEMFFNQVRGFGKDDYGGAQIAALYYLRPNNKAKRLVPYLTAGIGGTSTDYTEIEGARVVRLGGGVKYFFDEGQHFGLRFEARNEIIGRRNTIFRENRLINFPSARVGVIFRY